MKDKKTFYISTPIYYPSGNLHLGHVYTTFLCDALARYKRECGYDVFFLTGTDEHGQKIQSKAEEAHVTPQQFVDEIVSGIEQLWKNLQITNTDFIRTTQSRHEEVVAKVFSYFIQNGDIYLGQYEGWYCKECEAFFTNTQLVDGKCPDCGREVKKETEEAYFFKMSKYTDRLMKFYEDHPEAVYPQSRLNEIVNNFIKPGLEDLCVSRTSFSWGVKVKENPKHVVYVWIDALINYITALGYGQKDESNYLKFWENGDERVHVIGKEITRFHLIYWPIMLMALNIRLPEKFLIHGWIVMKDGKMSKSKGNVVYPLPIKTMYGMDALRYYLLREIPFCQDGMFTPEQFVERINSDLANDYGNLTHRSLSMINKYFAGIIPSYHGCVNAFDEGLESAYHLAVQQFFVKMDQYDVTSAIAAVFELISKANKYIDDTKPWALAKEESKREELASVMCHLANVIYGATILLHPFLTDGTEKILSMLNVPQELKNYEVIRNNFGKLENVKIIEKPTPVYARLDPEIEIARMKETIYKK